MTVDTGCATLIRGGTAVMPDGLRPGVDVRVEAGVITGIGSRLAVAGAEAVEAEGCLVAPGFVDAHVHGAEGLMFEEGRVAAVEGISVALARRGTTGFLATLASLPREALRAAVEAIAAVQGREPGARVLGIHLEGPFLNAGRAGAQVAAWMRAPSIVELDDLLDRSRGAIRMVTVAPETEGALPFIEAARARGVTVAVGHSEASEEEVMRAVAAGATHVTHLFNAMPEWHHRASGVVGVALTEDAVSVELICDGHHLGPRAAGIALRCKPPEQVVLVSDAVAALGLPEGEMDLFGAPCVVAGGSVRRADGGRLAGSCLTLAQSVRNLHAWQPDLPLPRLLAMVSRNPARLCGAAAVCGTLAVGARADVVVLTPDLSVKLTYCGGRMVQDVI